MLMEGSNLSTFWKDWLERVLWTLAEALVGVLIVQTADLPYWWVAPLAAVLAMIKGWIAQHVGNPDSAAIGGAG